MHTPIADRARKAGHKARKPCRRPPYLCLLREGETIAAKASDLQDQGVAVLGTAEILEWIEANRDRLPQGPIVIADATVAPIEEGESPRLYFVPGHGIDERGRIFPNGLIDLFVPMHPAKAGGQLALLVSSAE